MRRLFDVSVSILMATVLFMSQTWALTAAYADYSISASAGSNGSDLEGTAHAQDGMVSESQKSDWLPRIVSLRACGWLLLKRLVRPLLAILPKPIS